MKSETDLVHRAKENDRDAFRKLLSRYEKRIYNLAYRMTGDQEEAKDIVQDSFLAAYQHLKDFREEAKFGTWLYRIATNRSLMFLRRQARAKMVPLEPPANEEAGRKAVDWSQNPALRALNAELAEILEQAIQALPPSQRAPFILRDIEGFSNRETASLLGQSEESVKGKVHRARLFLRDRLSSFYNDEVKRKEKEQ